MSRLLTVSEATFAMDATADRCALIGPDGRIERTNAPWHRSTRAADPVPVATMKIGDYFVTACAQAALMGNRDAGTLHAQLRRLIKGEGDRSEIEFQRYASSNSGRPGSSPVKATITLERVPADSGDRVLVSFAAANLCDAQPTSVPEAGFAVPSGARFDRLATALDSLPSHAAILDSRGRVVAINAAWRMFSAVSGGRPETTGVGAHYLAVCQRAAQSGDGRARDFGEGLASVLRGERHTFMADGRVSSGGPARKFRGRVTALTLAEGRFTLVTHTELSETRPSAIPAEERRSIVLTRQVA